MVFYTGSNHFKAPSVSLNLVLNLVVLNTTFSIIFLSQLSQLEVPLVLNSIFSEASRSFHAPCFCISAVSLSLTGSVYLEIFYNLQDHATAKKKEQEEEGVVEEEEKKKKQQ